MITVLQVTGRVDMTGRERTWTFTTAPLDGLPDDADGGITDPGYFERFAFGAGRVVGPPQSGGGGASVVNPNGERDEILLAGVAGGAVTLWSGSDGATSFAGLTQRLNGIAGAPSHEGGQITFELRNRLEQIAAQPFQKDRYLGTNAGAEGVEGSATDLAGAYKPVVLGYVANAVADNVNTERHIHQISANSASLPIAGSAPIDIYDKAARFNIPYTQQADWTAFTGAADPSAEIWWYFGPEGWFIRLPARAAGTVTVTVQEGTEGASTIGQLVRRVLMAEGVAASQISGVEDLDAAWPEAVGYHAGQNEVSNGTVLGELLGAIFGTWLDDALGLFTLRGLGAPKMEPDHAFTALLAEGDGEGFTILAGDDDGEQPGTPHPISEVVVHFARNWHVQDGDSVATGVPNTDHGNFAAREYRQVTASNAPATAMFPSAKPYDHKTLFKDTAPAERVARLAVALFGERRFLVEIDLAPEDGLQVALFDTVRIPIGRFDWNERTFVVLGTVDDPGDTSNAAKVSLLIWG